MKTWGNGSYLLLTLSWVTFIFNGCGDAKEHVSLPVVRTLEVTNITAMSATSGGIVTDDGGAIVTNRGICWDIQPQPTTALSTKTSDGQDTGMFVSELSNLIPNQQYFVRAYAKNNAGTSYGSEISFFTQYHNTIVYKTDGRIVRLGDPFPIALDLSEDGLVDFTIFVELTASSRGDRLYAGMNAIGANQIKSGPPIDDNFLSMGFLVAETPGSIINDSLLNNQRWTSDFGALVIRNTLSHGEIFYEGSWADSSQIVGIQNNISGSIFFGWLRIEFSKITEAVTLIDYAYDSIASRPIMAGAATN